MIIGIDGNEANVEKKVGISEYAYELLQQFANFQSPRSASQALRGKSNSNVQFRIYLKDKPRVDMPKKSENWFYRVVGPGKLWTQVGLPIDLYNFSPRPDVFFSPTHYSPRFSPVPTAVSVMDLSFIHFPEMFKKKDLYQLLSWTSYSVKKAVRVFTISEASKNDIIQMYKVPAERVIVTYPGIKPMSKQASQTPEEIRNKHGIKGDYILFVGTIQPRKNLVRLIEAFAKLQNTSITLVVIGRAGWLFEEILDAPKKFHIESQVKFLDYVPDSELGAFYKGAAFYILPSLYEGFGLPVLEAMQYGCPVIVSKVSSLPEAAGDAALYVDPTNIDDISAKMQELLNDKTLRETLVKKGTEQVKKFSWEKTARETLTILEKMAK